MQTSFKQHVNFQLWETKVENDTQSIESTFLPLLSPSEHARLDSLSHSNKKQEYLCSRALLRSACSQIFNLPLAYWVIVERRNALPLITNLPTPLKYSLSHSNNLINFAVSQLPIGIDIEHCKIRKNQMPMARLFMTEAEYSYLEELKTVERQQYFYRIWCAKEAFFKTLDSDSQKTFAPLKITIEDNEKHHLEIIDQSDAFFTRIIILNKPHC